MPEIKNNDLKKLFRSLLFGIAAAVCVTVTVLFIAAVIMTLTGASSKFASPVSSVALGLGGLVGGWLSAVKNGKKGILCGFLTALAVFVIITVIGMFVCKEFSMITLIHFAVLCLSGCIGGIFGVNKSEKRKIL